MYSCRLLLEDMTDFEPLCLDSSLEVSLDSSCSSLPEPCNNMVPPDPSSSSPPELSLNWDNGKMMLVVGTNVPDGVVVSKALSKFDSCNSKGLFSGLVMSALLAAVGTMSSSMNSEL